MSYLIEWVTNIILFILLATVIDMLLPNSSMQKYTKMVTGLLLMAIILTPIFKLISNNFETTLSSITSFNLPGENTIKNSIDTKKKEIQAGEDAYILEQTAVQLKKSVAEELIKQYDYQIDKIDISTNQNSNQAFPDNLNKITVLLIKPDNEVETVEAVKKIQVNTNNPLSSQTTEDHSKEIAAFLSKQWDVNENLIQVSIEGGDPGANG